MRRRSHDSPRRGLFRRRRAAPAPAAWPVAERPSEPVFSIVSAPLPERPPIPRPPRPTTVLDTEVPPLEFVTPAGAERWLAELCAIAPLVLVLCPSDRDAGGARELCAELRTLGHQVLLATRGGDPGATACPAAFEVLGEGRGGVFVIDRGGVLRLSYALPGSGVWLPAGVVSARLRRLAGG